MLGMFGTESNDAGSRAGEMKRNEAEKRKWWKQKLSLGAEREQNLYAVDLMHARMQKHDMDQHYISIPGDDEL